MYKAELNGLLIQKTTVEGFVRASIGGGKAANRDLPPKNSRQFYGFLTGQSGGDPR